MIVLSEEIDSSLEGLKEQVKQLERQVVIINEMSEEQNHSDDLIDLRIKRTTLKIKMLEEKIEELNNLVSMVQGSIESSESKKSEDKKVEDTKEDESSLIPVAVVVAIIGFLSGPMIEIIKHLLRK